MQCCVNTDEGCANMQFCVNTGEGCVNMQYCVRLAKVVLICIIILISNSRRKDKAKVVFKMQCCVNTGEGSLKNAMLC